MTFRNNSIPKVSGQWMGSKDVTQGAEKALQKFVGKTTKIGLLYTVQSTIYKKSKLER